MKTYQHKPLKVQAAHVVAPYRDLKSNFPRSHEFHSPSGRISHFHIVDAIGVTRANVGDYVVRHADGKIEVFTDEQFTERYEERNDVD